MPYALKNNQYEDLTLTVYSAIVYSALWMRKGDVLKLSKEPAFWVLVIVLVNDKKKAGVVPFEEVKDEITKGLLARKKNMLLNQWVKSAKETATIEYVREEPNK